MMATIPLEMVVPLIVRSRVVTLVVEALTYLRIHVLKYVEILQLILGRSVMTEITSQVMDAIIAKWNIIGNAFLASAN
jgi:hypothetical protein